ncbi:hypothetical protein [Tenacibaculum amylolyticum]|uniref:hypothetical protein n=1 Tax=Tenacibaculum amylolyticum TaxID=104269 RepID=UPI00389485C7
MKKIFVSIILTLVIGCQSNKTKGSLEKITSERVYNLDENGNKKDLILIIEGNKMYTSNKEGKKIELLLEKFDNKVYEIQHKVVNNVDRTEKGRILFIFEKGKYWEYDKKTKQKGKLTFVRKENIIYQNRNNKLEKILIVD